MRNNTEHQLPTQIDVIIIPQCVREGNAFGSETFDQTLYDDEDDDDIDDEDMKDDDDDDVNDKKDEKSKLWMGKGGNNNKGRPIMEIKNIDQYLTRCGYKKNSDYLINEIEQNNAFNFRKKK
eukprot:57011_1